MKLTNPKKKKIQVAAKKKVSPDTKKDNHVEITVHNEPHPDIKPILKKVKSINKKKVIFSLENNKTQLFHKTKTVVGDITPSGLIHNILVDKEETQKEEVEVEVKATIASPVTTPTTTTTTTTRTKATTTTTKATSKRAASVAAATTSTTTTTSTATALDTQMNDIVDESPQPVPETQNARQSKSNTSNKQQQQKQQQQTKEKKEKETIKEIDNSQVDLEKQLNNILNKQIPKSIQKEIKPTTTTTTTTNTKSKVKKGENTPVVKEKIVEKEPIIEEKVEEEEEMEIESIKPASTSFHGQSIKGFTILQIPIPKSKHFKFIYYRKETSKKWPTDCTLYFANLPSQCLTLESLKLFLQVDDEIESISFDEENNSPNTAHIVFKSQEQMEKFVKDLQKIELSLPGNDIDGLEEMKNEQNQRVITDYNAFQNELDMLMMDFDKRKLLQTKETKAKRGKVDADGFVLVSGSKSAPPMSTEEAVAKLDKLKQKNFYQFQHRQTKKMEIDNLREKFNQDKLKLQKMQSKQRFKPY